MTTLTHVENQLNYYQRELRQYENRELSKNDHAYLEMIKIMVRDLKKAELKLKVK